MRDPELEVLTALAGTPSHVYELKFKLEERGLQKSHSDLYKMMNSLERRGLVTFTRVPSEKGPERKVFSITDTGKERLIAARRSGIHLLLSDYFRVVAGTFQDLMVSEFESDRPLQRVALFTDPYSGELADLFVAATADLTGSIPERWLIAKGAQNAEGFERLSAGAENLPCRDGVFDLIIAPALPNWDLEATLPELRRVLAPSAQLVTFLPFAEEMADSSLIGGFILREIAAHYPDMQIWRQVDFLRELDTHFDVMSVNYREFSLIFCRPQPETH
ncbi:helix-turn-helix transcriptional regulator [Methanofollis fontis]|uniref:Transcription regulator PadR N-terminal domain-containing protein n=1 Tax=Methanofollis fontis TaxID=2052832 RepID=A0A483CMI8_9EURY|nr:helix-turn-helix transcriptional regulator [Methanofollis fontis]TAJ44189.1 hypothetical protein CUJ86_09195 [Methanofollis fontis]